MLCPIWGLQVIKEEPYGKAVDIWSCGVVLYILCGNFDNHFGFYPFLTFHSIFTALHAPCDVPYLVTMVIGSADRGLQSDVVSDLGLAI